MKSHIGRRALHQYEPRSRVQTPLEALFTLMIDHSSLPEKKIFDGYFSLLMLPEIRDFFLPKMRKSSTQRPFRDLNLGGLIKIKQNPQRPLGILKFLLGSSTFLQNWHICENL